MGKKVTALSDDDKKVQRERHVLIVLAHSSRLQYPIYVCAHMGIPSSEPPTSGPNILS